MNGAIGDLKQREALFTQWEDVFAQNTAFRVKKKKICAFKGCISLESNWAQHFQKCASFFPLFSVCHLNPVIQFLFVMRKNLFPILSLLLSLFLSSPTLFAQSYTEVRPADGMAGDNFGRALDYDGNLLIVGANDAAYLFEVDPTSGCLVEVLKMTADDCPNCYPSNPAGGFNDPLYNVNTLSNFGYKVGLAGGHAFVSFKQFNDSYFAGTDRAQTYVYEKTASGWAYQSTINGYVVDAQGTTLLVRDNQSIIEYFGISYELLKLEVYSFGGGVSATLEDEYLSGGFSIAPAGAGLSLDGNRVIFSSEGQNYGTFVYDVLSGTTTMVDPNLFGFGDNNMTVDGSVAYDLAGGGAYFIGGGVLTYDFQSSLSPGAIYAGGWYFVPNPTAGFVTPYLLDFNYDPSYPSGGVYFYNQQSPINAPTGAAGYGASVVPTLNELAISAPSSTNGGAVYLTNFYGVTALSCFSPCGPIPNTLTSTDIGNTGGVATTICYDQPTGTYDITASGAGISGTMDGQNLVHQMMTGDGEIVCKVVNEDPSQAKGRTGVMMRASLDADAAFYFAGIEGDGTNFWKYRKQTGVASVGRGFKNLASWFKIVRTGQLFTAYRSDDGQTWYRLGAKTLPNMPATVYAGIATSSPTPGTPINVQVSDFQINGVAYRQGQQLDEQANSLSLTAYPVPTSDFVVVEGTAAQSHVSLKLMDQTGRVLNQEALELAAGNAFSHKVSLASLPAGIYLLQVQGTENSQTLRLIKE